MADDSKPVDFTIAFGALKDTPDSTAFLKLCIANSGSGDFATNLVFPRFREEAPDIEALSEYLWFQTINYAIPLHKRQQAHSRAAASSTGADLSSSARLVSEAKRAFIEYNAKYPNRASEAGELLAYLIALEFLNAAQIASKMALKTNGNMPIHGLDGVHALFENNVMTLYFLESKFSRSANDGVREYAESVAGFGNNRKQYLVEYEILSDLGNLNALDEINKKTALEYLDVYGPKKSQRLERSIGVICYSETKHYSDKLPKNRSNPPSAHEQHFQSNYSKELDHHKAAALTHLGDNNVDPSECEVFFIAVPDVNELRRTFYKCMYGHELCQPII